MIMLNFNIIFWGNYSDWDSAYQFPSKGILTKFTALVVGTGQPCNGVIY